MTITAKDILGLLAAKHAADVFVPECKTGPSWHGAPIRLDAWAMRRSWAHPETFGYEIKVSRSDFVADNKWTSYLDYCTHFSFVCPPGLIDPAELPDGIGLIVTSVNGVRLYTKRKAAPRDVQIPEDIWRYIVMCRTRVVDNAVDEGRLEWWKQWLQTKVDRRTVGFMASRSLAKKYIKATEKVRDENAKLMADARSFDRLKSNLVALGIDPESRWIDAGDVKRRIAGVRTGISPALATDLHAVRSAIDGLLNGQAEGAGE